jgi:hypothetical protein
LEGESLISLLGGQLVDALHADLVGVEPLGEKLPDVPEKILVDAFITGTGFHSSLLGATKDFGLGGLDVLKLCLKLLDFAVHI